VEPSSAKAKPAKGRPISIPEIMKYYTPKWLGALAMFLSLITSLAFPIQGFIVSNLFFILMAPDAPDYVSRRNFWIGMYLLLAVGQAIFGFC
jgi:hypothetical protein